MHGFVSGGCVPRNHSFLLQKAWSPWASLNSRMIFVPDVYAQILCHFPLTGCPFTKPDVIFKLEQEEEPWVVEEEELRRYCPG